MKSALTGKIIGVMAILFGIITIKAGGATLLIEEVRLDAGDYVPFVLWINFILGFAYIAAGAGLFLDKSWAKTFSLAIAGITLLTYAAFGIHIATGGLFKIKTVKAMAVRSLVWIGIAFYTVKTDTTKTENK